MDRRRLGWTAFRKISRLSGRSRAKAKNGSGSRSELLARIGGIGWLLRRTWACGTGGSRGERKHSIAPGDARTFANPTCSASARLVNFTVITCAILFVFALLLLFLCVFFPRYTVGEPGMGLAPVFIFICHFYFSAAKPSRCSSLCLFTSFMI